MSINDEIESARQFVDDSKSDCLQLIQYLKEDSTIADGVLESYKGYLDGVVAAAIATLLMCEKSTEVAVSEAEQDRSDKFARKLIKDTVSMLGNLYDSISTIYSYARGQGSCRAKSAIERGASNENNECSFCNKKASEHNKLLSGPVGSICHDCARLVSITFGFIEE